MRLPESKIEAAVSKDSSRYTLQAVKFDAEGKRVLATNGHILAIMPVEVSEDDHSGLISLDTIKSIRTMQKQSKTIPVDLHINGKATAESMGTKLEHELVTGQFPNCDMVVPKFEGPCTISLDADLLADLVEALRAKPGKHDHKRVVQLWVKDNSSAVLVKVNESEGTGVIMPHRV